MDYLIKKLRTYGADVDAALERVVGDEELYAELIEMFRDDENYEKLGKAIREKNYKAAFDAAHTLQGPAGNLALEPLYKAICAIVEPLRHNDYTNLDELYAGVMAQKKAFCDLLDD